MREEREEREERANEERKREERQKEGDKRKEERRKEREGEEGGSYLCVQACSVVRLRDGTAEHSVGTSTAVVRA